MAIYFKFHAPQDLLAACLRLGLDVRLSDDLAPLFEPVVVDGRRVGNRLCIQPMEGCDGTLDGRPAELTFRRWRRMGAGGAKLLWGEATAVVKEGRANPRQLILNATTAEDFRELVAECRRAHRGACGDDADLLIGLQLTHSGRYSFPRPLLACHHPLLDPLTERIGADYPLVSDAYLSELTDAYVDAARLAHDVGFQFVDVKQCHGYLLNELLSAGARPGPYGGSLANRTRLAREVIGRIRREVPELLIASRISVFDGVPHVRSSTGGIGQPCQASAPWPTVWGGKEADPREPDLAEPLAWIGEMASEGVTLVNVTVGNPYVSPHLLRPFEYAPPDGYESPEHPLLGVHRHFAVTDAVQRAFPQTRVVGSGYSYLQRFLYHAGAANVRDGRATFVGVGRASLPQPDFARQLQEHGRAEPRRVCRTFSYCTALMRAKHNELGQFAAGCPPFDKEVYGPIWDQARADGKERSS